jgi:hypothetical protein
MDYKDVTSWGDVDIPSSNTNLPVEVWRMEPTNEATLAEANSYSVYATPCNSRFEISSRRK